MDTVIANGSLLIVDYLRLKEFSVAKNKGSFLRTMWEKNSPIYTKIIFKLNYYSLLKENFIPHSYLLSYSSNYFINYRNDNAVKELEAETDKKYISYEECQAKERVNRYFLNPILYKKSLSLADKLAALLYFTVGVKCIARFNKLPHLKKFIPSNGARYPFKTIIYVNDENIFNLKAGVYKYDMKSHALVETTKHPTTFTPKNNLSIIYSADITRVVNRYPNAIYYKDLLFDYGHLVSILRSCIRHYNIGKYSTITDYVYEDFTLTKENQLLDLPFLQIDFTQDSTS
jgi:hypothetical protein